MFINVLHSPINIFTIVHKTFFKYAHMVYFYHILYKIFIYSMNISYYYEPVSDMKVLWSPNMQRSVLR